MKPPRVPLYNFPDVVLHVSERDAKAHTEYPAAKGGDVRAADLFEFRRTYRGRRIQASCESGSF